jgi:hypothetical protein
LTAPACVKRIYTNLAVIDVTEQGLFVLEMVPGLTLEELQALTEPKLQLANSWQALEPPKANPESRTVLGAGFRVCAQEGASRNDEP